MAAIVAGQGLGLFNTSRGLLGGQGQVGAAQYGRTGEQFYVNATNGNLVVQQQDEWLVGAGVDADFLRTYNSQGGGADDNGDNWRLALGRKVYGLTGTRNQAGSSILRVDADGNVAKYDYVAALGLYVSTSGSGAYDTLAFAGDKWTWTDGDTRQVDVYDSDTAGGKLIETQDRDGNKTGLYYDGAGRLAWVVHNPGTPETQDVVQLSYDSAGNLTELTAYPKNGTASKRVTYAYDNANRLQKVTVDLTPDITDDGGTEGTRYTTAYTYIDATSRLLKTVTHSDGSLNGGGSLLEFSYDTSNRVKTVTDVRGSDRSRVTTFDYQAGKTVVTDGAGGAVELAYDTTTDAGRTGQLKSVKALSGSTLLSSVAYEYSTSGDLLSATDHYNNKITYGYDAAGNRTYERDAVGNVVERSFSWNNQLLREAVYAVPDNDGTGPNLPGTPMVTRYTYDDLGRHVRFVVSPEGRVTEYRYNGLGQRVSEIRYADNAYPVSALQPADLIALGTLVSWASAANKAQTQRTDYAYDFRGQVASQTRFATVNASTGEGVIDGYQNTTQYFYDQAGQLKKTLDGNLQPTNYTYDGLGRLQTQTDYQGNVTTYTYIDAPGSTGPQTVVWRKDAAGAVLGRTTVQTYDAAGALVGLQELDAAASYQVKAATAYRYDATGRLIQVSGAGGQQTYYLYDAAGRKVGDIDPAGALTEYVYDGNGRVQSTIRYATLVSVSAATLAANPEKLVLAGTSPKIEVRPTGNAQDRVAYNLYDKAGRLAKTVDAEGAAVVYEYDGASRLVRTTAYSTLLSSTQVAYIKANLGTVAWDNATYTVPTQTTAEQGANRASRVFYDNDGRIVAVLDGEGALTRSTYDAAGRLVQVRRYGNAVIEAERGSDLARLISVVAADDAKDALTVYAYDSAGRQTAVFSAVSFMATPTAQHLGYLTTYQYDGVGNRAYETRYSTPVAYVAGTALASLIPQYAVEDQITYWAYDGLGRVYLRQVRSVAQTVANDYGLVSYYAYDAAGNLVQTIDGVAAGQDERKVTRRYDVLGRVTAELGAVGSKLLSDVLAANPAAPVEYIWNRYATRYEYDSSGRRIASITPDGSGDVGNRTVYYYDATNRLTYSINAEREVTRYAYNIFGEQSDEYRYTGRVAAELVATLVGGSDGSGALATALSGLASTRSQSGYDRRGLLLTATDELGNHNARTYNAFGEVASTTRKIDATRSLRTEYLYDRAGRALSVTEKDQGGIFLRSSSTYYDAFGRVLAAIDARGQFQAYGYDRLGRQLTVFDSAGVVTTEYDAFSRTVGVTDRLNNKTTYTYDSLNRSLTIKTPENVSTITAMNRHGQTVTVTDERGAVVKYDYDVEGKLTGTSVLPAAGSAALTTSSTEYDYAGRVLRTKDGRDVVTETTYDKANRVLTRTVDPGGLNLVTRLVYDAKGQTIWQKDPSDTWTQTVYDAKGQVTSVTVDPPQTPTAANPETLETNSNARALRTEYTYDAGGRTITVARGIAAGLVSGPTVSRFAGAQITRYVYDSLGRRVEEIADPLSSPLVAAGTTDRAGALNLRTVYTYDANDNVIAKQEAAGKAEERLTRYVYDAADRLIYSVDAVGAVVKTVYDAQGRVAAVTGYVKTIAAGNSLALTEATVSGLLQPVPTDHITRQLYDKDGRLTFTVDAAGYVTKRDYDKAGNVVQLTRYAKALSRPDSGGITVVPLTVPAATPPDTGAYVLASAEDQVEKTYYDAANRPTWSVDALNYVTKRVFDKNGNVVEVRRIAQPTDGTLTNGRPTVTEVDADDQRIRTVFDKANRAVWDVVAVNATRSDVVERRYDKNGRLLKQIRYDDQLLGTFAENVAPLPQATAPTGGASYVKPGAKDQTTEYVYDEAGRLTDTKYGSGSTVQSVTHNVYDDVSRLIDATVAYGDAQLASTTRYGYDAAGRVTSEIRAYGTAAAATTTYVLDGLGQRIETIDVRGNELADSDSAWAKLTRLGLVPPKAELVANLNATDKTQLRALYTSKQQFDGAGRVIKTTDAMGRQTSTEYDAFGNAVKVTDPNGNPGYFYFDARNQAVWLIDPEGYATETTYDAFGQKLSVIRYDDKIRLYGTGAALSVSLKPEARTSAPADGVVRAYVIKSDAKDRATAFTYDKRNQQKTQASGGYTQSVNYDAFGNRKDLLDTTGGTTAYQYDLKGRVKSEQLPVKVKKLDANGQEVLNAGAPVLADVINLFEYDARGNLTKKTEASTLLEQRVTTFDYDVLDRQLTRKGESMDVYTISGGNVPSQTPTESRQYDKRGRLIEVKAADGARTLTYWDELDRKIAEIGPTGTLTTHTYNKGGDLLSQKVYADALTLPTTPGGSAPTVAANAKFRETVYTYDYSNRLKSTSLKDVTVVERTASGSYSAATQNLTQWRDYDANGNLVRETDARGYFTWHYYDKAGNEVLTVDAGRYATWREYDAFGQVKTERRYATALAANAITLALNTSPQSVKTILDANVSNDDRLTTYVRDRLGRVTSETRAKVEFRTLTGGALDPAGTPADSTVEYTYFRGSNLVVSKKEATGELLEWTYDDQGRAIKQQGAKFVDYRGMADVRQTVDTEYNGLGLVYRKIQRGTAAEADLITRLKYDKNGWASSEIDPAGNETLYRYDAAGRVTARNTSRKDADYVAANGDANQHLFNDSEQYAYDLAGLQASQMLFSKKAADSAWDRVQTVEVRYNAFGQITGRRTYGGTTASAWQEVTEYDNAGRVWRSNAGTGGGALKVYYYDANGNATLELSSAVDDLGNTGLLPDASAASLSGLLSSGKGFPRFNVYDALNRLTDTYEPNLTGAAQAATITPRTVETGHTSQQSPFDAGSPRAVNPVLTHVSSIPPFGPRGGYVGGTDMRYWGRDYRQDITFPATTAYGSGQFHVRVNLIQHQLVQTRIGPQWRVSNLAAENYFAAGSTQNIRVEVRLPTMQNVFWLEATTEIYQVTPNGYEQKILSYYEKVLQDTSGEGEAVWIESGPTTYNVLKPQVAVSGLPLNAASFSMSVKPANNPNASWTPLANPGKLLANGVPVDGTFVADSGIAAGEYLYKYEALDGNGNKVAGATGRILINGSPQVLTVVADPRPDVTTFTYEYFLDWSLAALAAFETSIHRRRTYTAFGEVAAEVSYRKTGTNAQGPIYEAQETQLRYNTLGRLIERKEPEVEITLENGFQKRVNPTTNFHYDKAGRLIAQSDANGNVERRLLVAGSSDEGLVAAEFHAQAASVKRNYYDVFGRLRKSINENWDGTADATPFTTNYRYDALGNLTSIDRPGAADEDYEYDSRGYRIARLLAPNAQGVRGDRERTYYDALGRVTRTISAAQNNTVYAYVWVGSIGGTGGWRLTTTQHDGKTLIDDTDAFGRLRWHKDLGSHVFTYRYNGAGLLTGQTSLATDGTPAGISATGLVYTTQNITYTYYGNGAQKQVIDNVSQSWTEYRYDEAGNRIFEGYARNLKTATEPEWEYYQYSEAEYDAAGRLKRVHDPKSDIRYEYDAVGNRRRVVSEYQDGAGGGLQKQDYWYRYDSMNRFVVTMGALVNQSGAVTTTRAISESDLSVSVQRGSSGRAIGYDALGQRMWADTATGIEDYTYDAEGFLAQASRDGRILASRDNDARGNVTVFEELSWNGDMARHIYGYNADNQLLTDREEIRKADESSFKWTATTNTTLVNYLAQSSLRTEVDGDGHAVKWVTTAFDYQYWEDAKTTKIGITAAYDGQSRPWEPGSSEIVIDQVNGHVLRTHDLVANRWLYYTTDVDGRVIRREEIDGADAKGRRWNLRTAEIQQRKLYFQNYYFFNGREIGTVSTDPEAIKRDYAAALSLKPVDKLDNRKPASSADFDQNYQPIGTDYPSRTASVYTVSRDGETLPAIATAIWGDASLWYLLADANGLTNVSTLEKGQRLVIPSKVTNVHNNSQTFRPYDAGQAMGTISPTLPNPPPAKEKCGGMGGAILAVVAMVVAAMTQQWWAYQLGSKLLGAVAAAATGSVASQAVGVVTGLIDEFSWNKVAMDALSAGVAPGLGAVGLSVTLGSDILTAMANQAIANATLQGVAVATRLQSKFDWKGVAAAGLGAGLGEGMGQLFSAVGLNDRYFQSVFLGVGKAAVTGAVYGKDVNFAQVASESFVQEVLLEGASRAINYLESPRSSSSSAAVQGSGLRPGTGPGLKLTDRAARAFDKGVEDLMYEERLKEGAWTMVKRAMEAQKEQFEYAQAVKEQLDRARAYEEAAARRAAAQARREKIRAKEAEAKARAATFFGTDTFDAASYVASNALTNTSPDVVPSQVIRPTTFGEGSREPSPGIGDNSHMPEILGRGGRWVANPNYKYSVVLPINPMLKDAPDYTMRTIFTVLGTPVTGTLEVGATVWDAGKAAYSVARNELGYGLGDISMTSGAGQAAAAGMDSSEYGARFLNPVGGVMLSYADYELASARGDDAAAGEALSNTAAGAILLAGGVRGAARAGAGKLRSMGVSDVDLKLPTRNSANLSKKDDIPYTGVAELDAPAVNSSSFAQKLNAMKKAGFEVISDPDFVAARGEFEHMKFTYNPETMSRLDFAHEWRHFKQLQQMQERGISLAKSSNLRAAHAPAEYGAYTYEQRLWTKLGDTPSADYMAFHLERVTTFEQGLADYRTFVAKPYNAKWRGIEW